MIKTFQKTLPILQGRDHSFREIQHDGTYDDIKDITTDVMEYKGFKLLISKNLSKGKMIGLNWGNSLCS